MLVVGTREEGRFPVLTRKHHLTLWVPLWERGPYDYLDRSAKHPARTSGYRAQPVGKKKWYVLLQPSL